jgi:hypothetical protein
MDRATLAARTCGLAALVRWHGGCHPYGRAEREQKSSPEEAASFYKQVTGPLWPLSSLPHRHSGTASTRESQVAAEFGGRKTGGSHNPTRDHRQSAARPGWPAAGAGKGVAARRDHYECLSVKRTNRSELRHVLSRAQEPSVSRPFATEAALVETLATAIRRGCPPGWSLLREVDAGVGVADLVLASKPAAVADLRLLRSVPTRLAPLFSATTARKVRSLQAFMASTGMSRPSALRVLGTLAASGLAERDGETVQLRAASAAPFKHVIAIEAKLYDWGRALTQAYRNRQFATQSWVVLDAHSSVSKVAIDAFKQAGVGLAACSSTGEIDFYVKATTMRPVSPQRLWVAQAVLARSHRQALRPLR